MVRVYNKAELLRAVLHAYSRTMIDEPLVITLGKTKYKIPPNLKYHLAKTSPALRAIRRLPAKHFKED